MEDRGEPATQHIQWADRTQQRSALVMPSGALPKLLPESKFKRKDWRFEPLSKTRVQKVPL